MPSMQHVFKAGRKNRLFVVIALSFLLRAAATSAQGQAPPSSSGNGVKELRSAQSAAEILTPTDGVDFSGYIGKTVATVKRNWIAAMPAALFAGAKGKTTVEFRVRTNGKIENIALKTSSGADSLDRAVIQGVRNSSPLEPFPPNFKGSHITIRLSLAYNEAPDTAAHSATFDCSATASGMSQTPPFDRLELLAFVTGAGYSRNTAQVICQRGINFALDTALLTTLRYYGAAPNFVDSLSKITPKTVVQPAADRVSAYGLLDLALTDKSHGHLQQADNDFARAIKLAPDSATLRLAYARNLLADHNYSESEVQSRRSLELWPEDGEAHLTLAMTLSLQNRDSEAVPEAHEALRLSPGDKAALAELGISLARGGQYKEAIPMLRGVRFMAPQLAVIYKLLAGSLVHAGGDFDEAIQDLNLFLKTKPDDAEAHYLLGVALRGTYQPDDALVQFREAARLEPNNSVYAVNVVPQDSTEKTDEISKFDAEQPDDGFLSENVYTNRFFGFSYRFPKGWNVLKAEQGKAMLRLGTSFFASGDPTAKDVAEAAADNWHQLLLVSKQTTKDISTSTNLIQIEAMSTHLAPQLKTGAEYLEAARTFLVRSGKMSSMADPPERFEFAGRTFWKTRLDFPVNNVVAHEIEVAVIEKGYCILFIFASSEASTLDEIAATMNSLRFTLPPQ